MTRREIDDWYEGHLVMIAEELTAQEEASKKMMIQLGLAREVAR